MRNSWIVILTFSLAGCSSLHVFEDELVSCSVVKAGIIGEGKLTKVSSVLGTTSGFNQTYSGMRVTDETLIVPLKKDIHFGLQHAFLGLDKGEKIVEVVTHPLIVKPNGDRSTGYSRKKSPGNHSGYILNRDYELVAGEWMFEYFHEGKKLCGVSFDVRE